MKRTARIGAYIGAGVIGGLLLAFVAIQVLTGTSFGRERVRNFAMGWLNDQVHGDVTVGRIEGSLLRGAELFDLAIRDEAGRPFVLADSARVSYSWRTFLAGDIVIDRVVLYSPTIVIERLPGQEDWNYERIFADTSAPGVPDTTRGLIRIEDARIENGTVLLRTAWAPEPPIEPGDTARVVLEDVPGGRARVIRFEAVDATLDEVLWESPLEEGQLFRVASLAGRVHIWRDPIVVRDLKGTITLRDSLLAFEAPVVELPGTRASAVGRIVLGEEIGYDVEVEATRVALPDFRFLLPDLPEGGGSLALRIQTQPTGTLFLVENAVLSAPGTQMAGTFGIVTGDTLYFTRVDLRASPLNLDLIEDLLPGTLPVEGLLIGTVEVEGPLAALRTRGDVRLTSPGADESAVAWSGTLDVRGGRAAARGLNARLRGFDLALLDRVRPGLNLPGRVDGVVDASGSLDGSLRFTADLRHTSPGGELSEMYAQGSILDARHDARLAIEVDARSLAFGPIAEMYPSLGTIAGRVSGPVRLDGPARDLRIGAELETDGGAIALAVRVGSEGGRPRYGGEGRVSGFRLDRLRDDLPETAVHGRFAFQLSGSSLEDLAGTVAVDLDSLGVAGVGAHRVVADATVGDGLLRIDSLRARVAGGLLTAGGAIGLVEARTGALAVELASDGLEPLESALFGSIEDPTAPRITGSGTVTALLEGSVRDFGVRAEARLAQLTVGPAALARGSVTFDARHVGTGSAEYDVAVRADSLAVVSRVLDTATVSIAYASDMARIRAAAIGRGRPALHAAGDVARGDDATAVRVHELRLGADEEGWSLEDELLVMLRGGRAEVSPFRLARVGGGGQLVGGGTVAWAGDDPTASAEPMDLRLDLTGMPLAEAVRFTEAEGQATGTLHGTLRVGGSPRTPVIDAVLGIDELGWAGERVDSARVTFDYSDRLLAGRFGLYAAGRPVLHGNGGVPLDLSFAETEGRRLELPLDLTAQADSLPLAFLTTYVDGFTEVQGVLDGRMTAAGTAREPRLDGSFVVRRGAATWDATGVRYSGLAGTLLVRDDALVDLDLTARAGTLESPGTRGAARVQGELDLSSPGDPGFDLRVQADRLLAARRRDVELTASGEVTLAGRYSRPIIGGQLTVESGALYIDELYRQVLIVGLEDPLLFDVVDTSLVTVKRVLPESQSPFLRNLAVQDMRVTVGQGAWLRSRDMNVEVAGDLNVDFDRRNEDLRMTGTLAVVRGTYQLYYPPFARRFEVRQGTVEFPGTPGIDPNLRITAAYRARTPNEPLDILANVSGTLQSPRVHLSSTAEPPISESDLASYLFFGVPTYAFESGGRSDAGDGFAGLGVSAFAPTALGYVASGLQTLAQNFGLVDYVGLTAAEAAPGTPGDAGLEGLLATTELELGRYLSPTMFVAYTQRLATQNYSAGVRLEWRFHPTFTAEAFAEDRFARAPSFGYTEAAALRKVYGFSLFREWGY